MTLLAKFVRKIPNWNGVRPEMELTSEPPLELELLAFQPALHELADGLARGTTLVEHRVHLLSDRHFDAHAASKHLGGSGGWHAFGDHAHGADDFVEFAASAKFDSDAAVAAKRSGAGKNEVAHPRESRHRLLFAAERDAQAAHLREPTSDERGERIVAEAEAFGNARGDGNDILDRAAQLNTRDIRIRIQPKCRTGKRFLHLSGESGILRGNDDGCRISAGNLPGERRPRHRRDAEPCYASARLSDNFAHSQKRFRLQSFRGADNCRTRRNMGQDLRVEFPRVLRRHHADNNSRAGNRLGNVAGGRNGFRQFESRQENVIHVARAHGLDDFRLMRPKRNSMPLVAAREHDCERRSPASGADNRNFIHRVKFEALLLRSDATFRARQNPFDIFPMLPNHQDGDQHCSKRKDGWRSVARRVEQIDENRHRGGGSDGAERYVSPKKDHDDPKHHGNDHRLAANWDERAKAGRHAFAAAESKPHREHVAQHSVYGGCREPSRAAEAPARRKPHWEITFW